MQFLGQYNLIALVFLMTMLFLTEVAHIIDPENIRKNTYRIGDFRIEPTRNLIIKGELRQSIEPLIMDVLCELASYPGEVIGRFDLVKRIWKVDYGADESLTRAISILRKTFRNGGAKTKYIETISKNGYRLIAPVSPWNDVVSPQTTVFPKADLALSTISSRIAPISEPAGHRPPPTVGVKNSKSTPYRLIITTAFVIAIIGFGAQLWRSNVNQDPRSRVTLENNIEHDQTTIVDGEFITDPNRYGRSVAVLSFADMSAQSDQQYFADGMVEEILGELSAISSLRVVGRNASFAYKDRDVDLREIGDALKVSHVIDGSVRTQGNTVRVSAQLINTGDLTQLWSRSYDGNLKDGLALQDQISRDIVAELTLVLSLDIESSFNIDIPKPDATQPNSQNP